MATINNTNVMQRLFASGFDTDYLLSTPTKSFHVHKAIVQDFFRLDHMPDGCNEIVYDELSDASLNAMIQHIYGLPITCLQPKPEYSSRQIVEILQLGFAANDFLNFVPLLDLVVDTLMQIIGNLNNPSQLIDIGLYMCRKDLEGWIADDVWTALMAKVHFFLLVILKDDNLWKKLDGCERVKWNLLYFFSGHSETGDWARHPGDRWLD